MVMHAGAATEINGARNQWGQTRLIDGLSTDCPALDFILSLK
jgi:hypothetical protein